MKDFFKGVRKHIGRLSDEKLREQYELVADELAAMDRVIDTLPRGIIVLDDKGLVTRCNAMARKLLGDAPESVLPQLGIRPGRPCRQEIEIAYPEHRFLDIQSNPFEHGTVIYLRDITDERARAEEEIRSGATKAVSTLAAGVAHEIGNPLNAISLSLQLLKRDPTDTETIDTCMSQVKRLDGIIREFLTALRPQQPNLMPGSLAEPLKSCLSVLKQQFEERRIKVTLDIPAALPNVALDAGQMEQVFFNLLKNALEAMKDGSSIDIVLSSDDQNVSVSFRDSGVGMTADQLAHLFEPYRTSKERGTGLGLMISKRIVTDHGGTIAAESDPGSGTTFTVTLPRLERRVRVLK